MSLASIYTFRSFWLKGATARLATRNKKGCLSVSDAMHLDAVDIFSDAEGSTDMDLPSGGNHAGKLRLKTVSALRGPISEGTTEIFTAARPTATVRELSHTQITRIVSSFY